MTQHTWALALHRGTMNQAKAPISLTLPQCSAHLRLRSGSRWAGMRGVRSASMVRRREAQTRTWFAGIWSNWQPALSKRKPQERQLWRCSYNRGGWRCTSSQSKSLSFPWIRAVGKTLVLPVQGAHLDGARSRTHSPPAPSFQPPVFAQERSKSNRVPVYTWIQSYYLRSDFREGSAILYEKNEPFHHF